VYNIRYDDRKKTVEDFIGDQGSSLTTAGACDPDPLLRYVINFARFRIFCNYQFLPARRST